MSKYTQALPRSVQSAVTSVSFPKTLKELRDIGIKWLHYGHQDWTTDIDILRNFPQKGSVTWIAPKWLTAGDFLFFYHTKTAWKNISALLKEIQHSRQMYPRDTYDNLFAMLERAEQASKKWMGNIFAFSEVSGTPQKEMNEYKHFKGTIYAPLASLHIFESPVSSERFGDFLKIGRNTITPIYGEQLIKLKDLLIHDNQVPDILKSAVPTDLSFRNVDKTNWVGISCRKEARFINEAQLRSYLLDYLLEEIKDCRAPKFVECSCFRNGNRTGIADYFIAMNDKWLPIEAKLNVNAEQDLPAQISKYINIEAFSVEMGIRAGRSYSLTSQPFCLVFDQAGLYLTCDSSYMHCSSQNPLIKREEITFDSLPKIRKSLIELMR